MSPNVPKWEMAFIEARDLRKHPKNTAQKRHKMITLKTCLYLNYVKQEKKFNVFQTTFSTIYFVLMSNTLKTINIILANTINHFLMLLEETVQSQNW